MTVTSAVSEELQYFRTAERPALEFWLLDADGALLDFSSGYEFELKLGTAAGEAAVFTKTDGITGAAGSGTELTGAPNVSIEFAPDELADLKAMTYLWQLRATTNGRDRFYQGWLQLLDVLT